MGTNQVGKLYGVGTVVALMILNVKSFQASCNSSLYALLYRKHTTILAHCQYMGMICKGVYSLCGRAKIVQGVELQ